jgi:hypothetical protein
VAGQLRLCGSPDRVRPVVALAALGALLLAAGSVRASCGDYVHVRGPGSTDSNKTARPPARPPAPCHGPNCSQGPQRLPFAPVVPTVSSLEHWATPCSRLRPTEPAGSDLLDAPGPAGGIRRASPPAPPPRLLCA